MTEPARVLLVDDSVVVRRLVADALEEESRIRVVGTAANGRIGLAKITRTRPEVVVLDVEMPVLDGLDTLAEIAKLARPPRVIMFSTLTRAGAAVTTEALTRGAADYVAKPSNVGGVAEAQARVRREMVPKILSLVPRHRRSVSFAGGPRPGGRRPAPRRRGLAPRVDVLVIGCSTGGPNALAEVVPRLCDPLPVPALIVQHMPPVFTRFLAARLDAQGPHAVCEGTDGDVLEPGRVYLAPGGHHMSIRRASAAGAPPLLSIHDGPLENSCRPSVDVLFRSAVECFGAHTLGVVLTGMGKDGLAGCRQIQRAGGRVVSQDERSSVVWGMPGWVARERATDAVLPLARIAPEVSRRLELHRSVRPTAGRGASA
jgi:two-component system chemotaxis response regulator CheB